MQDFRNLLRRTPSGDFFYNIKSETHPDVEMSIQAGKPPYGRLYCLPHVSSPDPFIYTHFEVGVIHSHESTQVHSYLPVEAVQSLFDSIFNPPLDS